MSCRFEEEVLLLGDDALPFARRVIVEAHLCGVLCAFEADFPKVLVASNSCGERYVAHRTDDTRCWAWSMTGRSQ